MDQPIEKNCIGYILADQSMRNMLNITPSVLNLVQIIDWFYATSNINM